MILTTAFVICQLIKKNRTAEVEDQSIIAKIILDRDRMLHVEVIVA